MDEYSMQDNVKMELMIVESIFGEELEEIYQEDSDYLAIKLNFVRHCESIKNSPTIKVHLKITTSEGYPCLPATFSIDCESLEDASIQELTKQLNEIIQIAAKEKNSVMASMGICVVDFLNSHEQMLTEKENEKKRQLLEQEIAIKQTNERILKDLKQEQKQRTSAADVNVQGSHMHGHFTKKRSLSVCETPIEPRSIVSDICGVPKRIVFHQMLHRRRDQPCTVYRGLFDTNLCLLYDWQLDLTTRDVYKQEELLKELKSIQQQAKTLVHLSHPNLVPLLVLNLEQEEKHVGVTIIQEYIGHGMSLRFYIDNQIALPEVMLQRVARGITTALHYLHSKDISHYNLRDSCIFVDADMGEVRLADFYAEHKCVAAFAKFSGSDPRDTYPESPGKAVKKADIYRLGLILISLAQGARVDQGKPDVPKNLSPSLTSFIDKCLALSDHLRWTTAQLLAHPFISSTNIESIDEAEDTDDLETADESFVWSPSKVSRFHKDYEQLEVLGRGGFGQVWKVRHKMANKFYAMKGIPMKRPTKAKWDQMLNEVRLLSSLNHENVVRYYTSWVEVLDEKDIPETTDESDNEEETLEDNLLEDEEESDMEDELSCLAGQADWVLSKSRAKYDVSLSDGYEDIVFCDSGAGSAGEPSTATQSWRSSGPRRSQISHILYISMEFCENRTLRQAIDKGLPLNPDRHWQLFRELITGIDYIHSRGLIHRDLKPGNIFLNSKEHVKIGDFGLAKVDLKAKALAYVPDESATSVHPADISPMTKYVGTTLYVAPETNSSVTKSYSRKVDMYSLGIIFFEILYYMETGSERALVLTNIRKPEPELPRNVDQKIPADKKEIILKLLTHDPAIRPTARDLLASKLLPPPTAEHQKFLETLRDTISNARSTDYKDLLENLFQRSSRPELEASFELAQPQSKLKQIWLLDHLQAVITSIFKNHGALWVATPFFTPKNAFNDHRDRLPQFMSKAGEIICAQYELHYPFARYIARNNTKRIRRYCVDRVQRDFVTSGVHPCEWYQCAFDLVERFAELPETFAKVFRVAQDCIQSVTKLDENHVTIQLCHQQLTRLILKHCRIDASLHDSVIMTLKGAQNWPNPVDSLRDLVKGNVAGLDLLSGFLNTQGPVAEVLEEVTKRVCGQAKDTRQQLQTIRSEISQVLHAAQLIGITFNFTLHPMTILEPKLFNGISFQFVYEEEDSLVPQSTVFARGGAYEDIVVQHAMRTGVHRTAGLCSVGVSLPLYHLMTHVKKHTQLSALVQDSQKQMSSTSGVSSVFLCSLETSQLEQRLKWVSELREKGISADHGFFSTKSEAVEILEELWYISYVVFLDANDDNVHVRTIKRTSAMKKCTSTVRKMNAQDVVGYLAKLFRGTRSAASLERPVATRKEAVRSSSINEASQINIEFVTKKSKVKDEKLRNTIMDEVNSYISHHCAGMSVNQNVEILAVDFDRKDLRQFGVLDTESNQKNFNDSCLDLKNKFSDSKEQIDRLCKLIHKRVFTRTKKSEKSSLILLYSIPSETFKRI